MKPKTNIFFAVILCICAALNTKAQQTQNAVATNNTSVTAMQKGAPFNYTYRVFQAPNKMYGYDIFRNGKGIFHQGASPIPKDAKAFTNQQIAEKAAALSIEKIKSHAPATLSQDEIKKQLLTKPE